MPTDPPRPTWSVGPSVCHSFLGFTPIDLFPIRSPLAVADFLGPQLVGRSFCEIGTRNGDVMSCLSHFTSALTAVEMDQGYCKKLRDRGFGVACIDVETIPARDFPMADVYYWWPSDAGGQNELWLLLVARALRKQGRTASVFIGADNHWEPDMKYLPALAKRYNGTVTRLFFDEGGALDGKLSPRAPGSPRPAEFEASLARPFFSRPGHWGVFHVTRFDVGPAFWELMDQSPFSHPVLARHRKGVYDAKGRGTGRSTGRGSFRLGAGSRAGRGGKARGKR